MHISSMAAMQRFVDRYLAGRTGRETAILDLGSQSIGGSYRPLFDRPQWRYLGVDVIPGPNVDLVLADPYRWNEIADESYDVVISGQAFEHIEFFWLTIEEVGRVLAPGGMACIIAPSAGHEHRYPVDCWRFYPDGMRALAWWGGLMPVEAITQWDPAGHDDYSDAWQDSVLIAARPSREAARWQEAYRRDPAAAMALPFDPGELSPFAAAGRLVVPGERVALAGPERPGFTAWIAERSGRPPASSARECDTLILTGGDGPPPEGGDGPPRIVAWRIPPGGVLPEGWQVADRVVWRPEGKKSAPMTAGRYVTHELLIRDPRPVTHTDAFGQGERTSRAMLQRELERTYQVVEEYRRQIDRLAMEGAAEREQWGAMLEKMGAEIKQNGRVFAHVEKLALERQETIERMAEQIRNLKKERGDR